MSAAENKKDDVVDYKELLSKYIQHVMDCEGESFLHKDKNRFGQSKSFTDKEHKELLELGTYNL